MPPSGRVHHERPFSATSGPGATGTRSTAGRPGAPGGAGIAWAPQRALKGGTWSRERALAGDYHDKLEPEEVPLLVRVSRVVLLVVALPVPVREEESRS